VGDEKRAVRCEDGIAQNARCGRESEVRVVWERTLAGCASGTQNLVRGKHTRVPTTRRGLGSSDPNLEIQGADCHQGENKSDCKIKVSLTFSSITTPSTNDVLHKGCKRVLQVSYGSCASG
jgi:hypothetical protein